MAKLDFVFVDEVADNQNRYKAINIATGEEIVFDLLRYGNIKVQGTPLEAKVLNKLVEAINENYDLISNIDKNSIGLSNVVNERQYSAQNQPPYPVTSVNGKTGNVIIDLPQNGFNINIDFSHPKHISFDGGDFYINISDIENRYVMLYTDSTDGIIHIEDSGNESYGGNFKIFFYNTGLHNCTIEFNLFSYNGRNICTVVDNFNNCISYLGNNLLGVLVPVNNMVSVIREGTAYFISNLNYEI